MFGCCSLLHLFLYLIRSLLSDVQRQAKKAKDEKEGNNKRKPPALTAEGKAKAKAAAKADANKAKKAKK